LSTTRRKPKIMVSSTVYGIEELLERVYTLLVAFGYEVWMSHKGTLPVRSDRTAFENCLAAVQACDLFLGIITPDYGSGQDRGQPSITHLEIRRAIELEKPRWLLTHGDVVFARRLLRELGYGTSKDRQALVLNKGAKALTDLRVIDLYEEAILHGEPLADRAGNWAQEFRTDADALLFATAQFSRFQEVEEFIRENLSRPQEIQAELDRRQGDEP
jgi:nucleoside 2-deoxyribosyltransferase